MKPKQPHCLLHGDMAEKEDWTLVTEKFWAFSCQISLVCFVKILLLATTQFKKKKKIQMETDLKFKRNFKFHRNSFPCCLCGLCLPRIN